MSKDLEIIKIEGTEIEATVGSVAEDLGLLYQMELELSELLGKARERCESKAFEHQVFVDTLLADFKSKLSGQLLDELEDMEKRVNQHKANTQAGIDSINESTGPEQTKLSEQIQTQKESIKPLILAYGKTIKGSGKMAKFVKGSRKADLDALDKHITSLIKTDKFEQAKFFTNMIKEGKPSVTFAKNKLDGEVK